MNHHYESKPWHFRTKRALRAATCIFRGTNGGVIGVESRKLPLGSKGASPEAMVAFLDPRSGRPYPVPCFPTCEWQEVLMTLDLLVSHLQNELRLLMHFAFLHLL